MTAPLAALFPVNMGNRGQNVLPLAETFQALRRAATRVRFVAYHPRISGNFLFESIDADATEEAVSIAERITGLRCLVRRLDDLAAADRMVPSTATVVRDSIVIRDSKGVKRVIFVGLSEVIVPGARPTGRLGTRIEVLCWPSAQDVICLYDRPGEPGDVGQVTRALVRRLRKLTGPSELIGTGRAMMVIRDLLSGRRLRGCSPAAVRTR